MNEPTTPPVAGSRPRQGAGQPLLSGPGGRRSAGGPSASTVIALARRCGTAAVRRTSESPARAPATTTTAPATTATTSGRSLRRRARGVRHLHAHSRCLGLPRLRLVRVIGRDQGCEGADGADLQQRGVLTGVSQAAQRSCAKYYGPTAPPQHVSPQQMQRLLAVSRCMRAHGVPSFPDPNPTTGELVTPAGWPSRPPASPRRKAARDAAALGRAAGLRTSDSREGGREA